MKRSDEAKLRWQGAEAFEFWRGEARNHEDKVLCPSPMHSDSDPSCHIYDDGHAHCYSCGAHYPTIIHWVMDLREVDYGRAVALLLGEEYREYQPRKIEKKVQNRPRLNLEVDELEPLERNLELVDDALYLLEARGVSEEIRKAYHLGYNFCHPQLVTKRAGAALVGLTMPVWNGHVYHVEVRKPQDGPDWQKRYMSIGGNMFAYLEQVNTPYVHVVESKLDALLLMSEYGQQCAIASPANKLTVNHILLLSDFKRIFLWPDNDTAGLSTTARYLEAFTDSWGESIVTVVNVPRIKGVKDIGDFWALNKTAARRMICSI